MNNPKVSIIIPVYNTEKYLEQCLESIINQTYKNIEIICVDDGSTDNSLAILHNFQQKDSRIKVYTQKNNGTGVCRNKGIMYSTGEYIMFADSDDWLNLSAIEKVVDIFVSTGVKVIQFDFLRYIEASGAYLQGKSITSLKKHHLINPDKNKFYNWKDVKPECLWGMGLACWQRAYSKSFLEENNIKFSPFTNAEDILFKITAVLKADKFFILDENLYYYRIRQGSSVNSFTNNNFCAFKVIKLVEEYLNKLNLIDELKNEFQNFKINILLNSGKKIPTENKSKFDKICLKILSRKEYIMLNERAFNYKHPIENLFSVKNVYKQSGKFKSITLFGHNLEFRVKTKEPFKVDMVYLWCDINDENFKKKKTELEKQYEIEDNSNNECRYINNDELKYSLRSLEKYANWINNIYIVTASQTPKWLNTNNNRIKIIDHKDIMPNDVLPSFNSNAIEHCIKNIPELSEYFLYGNDDTLFFGKIDKSFFFSKSGYPIIRHIKKHKNLYNTIYGKMLLNTQQLFFKKFKKEYKFVPHHNIDAYRKSDIINCYNIFKDEIDKTIKNHFRTQFDVQRVIYSCYSEYLSHGKLKKSSKSLFYLKKVDTLVYMSSKIGIEKKINHYKPKLLCINDGEWTTDNDRAKVKSILEKLFPDKSEFEL